MIKAGIIGATGYSGQELVRILCSHPDVELVALTSRKNNGVPYAQLFPAFAKKVALKISEMNIELLAKSCDVVFVALPHAEAQDVVSRAYESKLRVIDLSADFRFRKASVYGRFYGEHRYPHLLRRAVFGLAELYREEIRDARIVANPGCYPTSVILALKPLLSRRLIEPRSIIVDSKSGLSGAGRGAVVDFLFCEAGASVRAYNVFKHRHQPEMEQELSRIARKKVEISFVPHLVPVSRGILSTIYVRFIRKVSLGRVYKAYQEDYESEPFIRLLVPGDIPDIIRVRGSNFCDIGIAISADGKSGVIFSAIDNLVKGASGNAVQNLNIMFGIEETKGLDLVPLVP